MEKNKLNNYIHPILGQGIEDNQGLIWFSISEKKYNHYEALEYAKSLNVRLPTKEEIKFCIKTKFNLGKDDFWSSSVHPNYPYDAFDFNGSFGYVGYDGRVYDISVRCVLDRNTAWDNKLNELLNE